MDGEDIAIVFENTNPTTSTPVTPAVNVGEDIMKEGIDQSVNDANDAADTGGVGEPQIVISASVAAEILQNLEQEGSTAVNPNETSEVIEQNESPADADKNANEIETNLDNSADPQPGSENTATVDKEGEQDAYGFIPPKRSRPSDFEESTAKKTKAEFSADDMAFYNDDFECNFEKKEALDDPVIIKVSSDIFNNTGATATSEFTDGEDPEDDDNDDDDSHAKCRSDKKSLINEIDFLRERVDRLMQRQMLLEDFAVVEFPVKFKTFFRAREKLLEIGKKKQTSNASHVIAPGSSFLINMLRSVSEQAEGHTAELNLSTEELERLEFLTRKKVNKAQNNARKTAEKTNSFTTGITLPTSSINSTELGGNTSNFRNANQTLSNSNSTRGPFVPQSLPDNFTVPPQAQSYAATNGANITNTMNSNMFQNPFHQSPQQKQPANSRINMQNSSQQLVATTSYAANTVPMSSSAVANVGEGEVSVTKRQECLVCGRSMNRNTLRKHMNLHIGIVFQCQVCKTDRLFLRDANKCFKEHDASQHPLTLDAEVKAYLICDDGTRRLVKKEEEEGIRLNFLTEIKRILAGDKNSPIVHQVNTLREQMMLEERFHKQNKTEQERRLDQEEQLFQKELNEMLKKPASSAEGGVQRPLTSKERMSDAEHAALMRVPLSTSILVNNLQVSEEVARHGYFTAPAAVPHRPQIIQIYPEIYQSYESGQGSISGAKKRKRGKRGGVAHRKPTSTGYAANSQDFSTEPMIPSLMSQQNQVQPQFGLLGTVRIAQGYGQTRAQPSQNYGQGNYQSDVRWQAYGQGQVGSFNNQVERVERTRPVGQQSQQGVMRSYVSQQSQISYGEYSSYAEYAKSFLQSRPYFR